MALQKTSLLLVILSRVATYQRAQDSSSSSDWKKKTFYVWEERREREIFT